MTNTRPTAEEPPAQDTEAYQVLLFLAHDDTGSVPAEILVHHVMRITRGADWPVRRAAMEACLRRFEFARRDELRVAERPPGRQVFGVYRTRRSGAAGRQRTHRRPYETVLQSLDPLTGSCDCPDFARGSLGLCKHLLAVLDDLAGRPRRLRAALAGPAGKRRGGAALTWDPIRPLTGAADWLERVRLEPANGSPNSRRSAFTAARPFFKVRAGDGLVLRSAFSDQPERRLKLVETLQPLLRRRGPRSAASAALQPALATLLAAEKEHLGQIVAGRTARRQNKAALRTLKRKLYPYQVQGVLRALEAARFMLADDMGLGKTAEAIGVCHVLWHTARLRRGLLIVPASLKAQWLREWQLFTDLPVRIVDGNPDARRRAYRAARTGFLIANYEQVLRDLPLIEDWNPRIVVLDEAQRIKNWATKTAACIKKLRPPLRLVLTGTPMENRLEELASILEWVDDMAMEPKWRLVPWHTIYADGRTGAIGARNLTTLRQRMSPCVLRRTRQEVLDQLPPRTDTVVPIELTEAQREEHDALRRPIVALVHIAERRKLTHKEFLRLMQLLTTQRIIANGLAQHQFTEQWPRISGVTNPTPALLRGLESPKLLELREILVQLVVEQRRKVVVFSQWRRMLRLAHWAVEGTLASAGARAAFFSGQESQRRRTRNLVDFHDDPDLRVLFATDAGGVGLNLQRAANCCINLELPWNPAVLEQRIGRIYRIGQKDPIDVYNLVSRDCIEERIAALVADKKALFDGVFEGTDDEIRFERSASFMSTVARIVEPAELPDLDTDDDGGAGEAQDAAERELEKTLDDDSDEIEPVGVDADGVIELKPVAPDAPLPPATGDLRTLLAKLSIRTADDGRVSIEAPPEAAAGLAAAFDALAGMLRGGVAAAQPPAAHAADPILRKSIAELDLSMGTGRRLDSAGIRTMGDLVRHSQDSLLAHWGFGRTSLREVRRRLAERGLCLRDDSPADEHVRTGASP